jgi:hypothetical protein
LKFYPPSGDAIRDAYDEASNSYNNPWKLSDHMRHTREMQAVQCHRLYAEDHTHQMTKNYFRRKTIGALALWDVATETGEIATAVLVPSTKTQDLSHAAMSLAKRPNFAPKAMYSDRWPVKMDYWERVFGHQIEGRLGLFHFTQRIVKTLRKRHIDYFLAINSLLNCIYFYNEDDHEALLTCLKNGSLNGKLFTDDDIAELKSTRYFRQRHGKHLRKEIRPPNIMRNNLDQWFARFKCSASDNSPLPALGRPDPISGDSLFTNETKDAVRNCKEKCQYLQDPLPLDQMYDVIRPNPNSPHGLNEYMSRRGESNLESFHLMLAHFGNTGMRESLADNLNLTGTARYNLHVRFKLELTKCDRANVRDRAKIPAGWETVLEYFNHTELAFINQLATKAGLSVVPFPQAEALPPDNGERFFSEYLAWRKQHKPKTDTNDLCLCKGCCPIIVEGESLPPVHDPAESNEDSRVRNEGENQLQVTVCQPPDNNNNQIGPSNVVPPQRVTTNAGTTAATIINHQQQFIWNPFVPTPMWINPYMIPPTPGWERCCRKYTEYCNRSDRRGRPPHDLRCAYRNMTNNVNDTSK